VGFEYSTHPTNYYQLLPTTDNLISSDRREAGGDARSAPGH
jgi:hypothetical protein